MWQSIERFESFNLEKKEIQKEDGICFQILEMII